MKGAPNELAFTLALLDGLARLARNGRHLPSVRVRRPALEMSRVVRHVCPICKGAGRIEAPKHDADAERRARVVMARALHGEGYSLRQIAKLVGWKSVRSAALAVADQKLG